MEDDTTLSTAALRDFSATRRARRNISKKLRIMESNHAARAMFDTLLENCIFYISPMYEFLQWGNSGIEPYSTGNQLSRNRQDPPRVLQSWRTAMEHYVGLDVSLKLTAICIVDRTGKIEREGVVASDPETIAAFIRSHAPHVARVGLETGATSTWLWTELNNWACPSSVSMPGMRRRL